MCKIQKTKGQMLLSSICKVLDVSYNSISTNLFAVCEWLDHLMTLHTTLMIKNCSSGDTEAFQITNQINIFINHLNTFNSLNFISKNSYSVKNRVT